MPDMILCLDAGNSRLKCGLFDGEAWRMQGAAPQVAIEFGRKVLYSTERPTFAELETHVKKK